MARTVMGILCDLRRVDDQIAALASMDDNPAINLMMKGVVQIREDLRVQLAEYEMAD